MFSFVVEFSVEIYFGMIQRAMGEALQHSNLRETLMASIDTELSASAVGAAQGPGWTPARPNAHRAGGREDLGQGCNFESFLPVRSRLASAHRWLVAIGRGRAQELRRNGPTTDFLVVPLAPVASSTDWLHQRKPTDPRRHTLFTLDWVSPQLKDAIAESPVAFDAARLTKLRWNFRGLRAEYW